MSYDPRLSRLAEQRLVAQPEPLREFIIASLERLVRNPASLSQPAKSLSRVQIAEFKFEPAGVSI